MYLFLPRQFADTLLCELSLGEMLTEVKFKTKMTWTRSHLLRVQNISFDLFSTNYAALCAACVLGNTNA